MRQTTYVRREWHSRGRVNWTAVAVIGTALAAAALIILGPWFSTSIPT